MADQYGLVPFPLGVPFDTAAPEQANQPADIIGGFIAGWAEPSAAVSFSVTFTEGADTLAAQVGVAVAASLAQTEGADVLAAQAGPRVAASLAQTEGADTLAAQAGPVVASSASLSEGADVLAAAVSIAATAISVSAALSEGADVLAAGVGPVVATSAGLAEGADSLSAQVGPQVAHSADLTEGQDVLDAQAGPVLGFAAGLQEGADEWQTAVALAVQGGGYDDDKPKRKRYVVERNGKLVVYASQAAALRALQASETAPAQEPAEEVELPVVQAYAEVAGRLDEYTAAYNSRHFEQLMALFDQMRTQLDEEDVEMLLLAV